MIDINPINQTKLFGLDKYISELIKLYTEGNFPNKLLLSGSKGLGKSTMAFHMVNYILSKDQEFNYQLDSFQINPQNQSFKTIINKSNPNFLSLDVNSDKKFIDINQIRELISKLNKSSFNEKPRFVLIDNIEYLNTNSINALLKILEEPNFNVHFILINNNKKILPTLLSRCINFRISLTNKLSLDIANLLLDNKLYETINTDLINAQTGNITPVDLKPARDWDRSGKRFGATAKSKEKLGFSASTSIKDGLSETVDWTKKNEDLIFRTMENHNLMMKQISRNS